jgi:hypothetical protein
VNTSINVPGFPVSKLMLPCDGNFHWATHFFETLSTERFFSNLLGAENIASLKPASGVELSQSQLDQIGRKLQEVLQPAVAAKQYLNFQCIDSKNRTVETRYTICAGRLSIVIASDDQFSGEIVNIIPHGDSVAAMQYTIKKVLQKMQDKSGKWYQVLPLPSHRFPLRGDVRRGATHAHNVQVGNWLRFGLRPQVIDGQMWQVYNSDLIDPID